MTKEENKLLSELKDFFNNKFGEKWIPEFKKYTSKLVKDGHINQETVNEFLDDDIPNEIVKRFKTFTNHKYQDSQYDGCGGSSRNTRTDGCGSSNRSKSSC